MLYIGFEDGRFEFTELHRKDFREAMFVQMMYINPITITSGFYPVPRKYERMRLCA